MVRPVLGLERPPPLDGVEAEGEGVGGGEEGHEGALLQLVAQDGGVRPAGGAHGQAGGGVADGNGQARLGSDDAAGGDADAAGQLESGVGSEGRFFLNKNRLCSKTCGYNIV